MHQWTNSILDWLPKKLWGKIETLEQGITEEEQQQIYWTNRPSVGHIFKETLKKIIKKAWIKIKFNYILDHPELLPKFLPLITQTISPISIEVEYFRVFNKRRVKWKSADQQLYNFKFRWKRKETICITFGNFLKKNISDQFTINSYSLQSQYHKYSNSKPNLVKITLMLFNPPNLIAQLFCKKGIFKEKLTSVLIKNYAI
jgi:hypothetical protein